MSKVRYDLEGALVSPICLLNCNNLPAKLNILIMVISLVVMAYVELSKILAQLSMGCGFNSSYGH